MSNIILIVLVSLLSICAIVQLVITIKQNYKKFPEIISKPIDTNLVDLMLTDNFVGKVNALIDSIIKEHADIYQVMVLSVNEDKAQYITSEQQDEMQKYVIHMTLKNLSPELKSIMELVYNIDDPTDLRDIISLRVKLYLINFVVEYNQDLTE